MVTAITGTDPVGHHSVLLLQADWGQVRPETHLVLTLLSLSPTLHFTIVADRRGVQRTNQELSAHPALRERYKDRFRLITAGNPVVDGEYGVHGDLAQVEAEYKETIGEILDGLLQGDKAKGVWGLEPKMIIVDLIQNFKAKAAMDAVFDKYPTIQKLVMLPTLVTGIHPMSPDILRIRGVLKSLGPDDDRVKAIHVNLPLDELVPAVPPLPSLKRFEHYPAYLARKDTIADQLLMRVPMTAALRQSDGLITAGTPEMEGFCAESYARELGVPVYSIGNDQADAEGEEDIPAVMNNTQIKTDSGETGEFLDKMLKLHGQKSLAYISFGSHCWPTLRPELVDYLVESLLVAEPPIPFILAVASSQAELGADLLERVAASGRGLISSWVSQRNVLNHLVTSFFVTHAGCGSMYEAIAARVPMVLVPQYQDQPLASALLHQLGVGRMLYQFFSIPGEMTTSSGVPVTSTKQSIQDEMAETWAALRGEEGDLMRGKIQELAQTVRKSRESGAVYKDLQAMLGLIHFGKK